MQCERIIPQDENGFSCFSKKFNEAQLKYPATAQEFVLLAETLKFHHNNICRGEIIMKADHKNLTLDMTNHKSE